MNIKKEIRKFLKSNEKKLYIEYKPKRLTAAAEWYKFRNPVGMVLRGLLFEIFSYLPPCKLKNSLYRAFGVNIGKDVTLSEKIYIDPLFPELITLEGGAILGTHCVVVAHGISKNKVWLGRTTIKKFAVIGGYAYVRPGITVGENAIVANFSLATKDVPKNTIVASPSAKPK